MTKQSKGNLDRVLAIILAAVSIIALFLPYKVLTCTESGYYEVPSKLLFLSFGGNNGALSVLPMICAILMLATALASAVLSVIAVINTIDGPDLIRVSSLVLSAGAGFYSLSVFALSMYQSKMQATGMKTTLDILSLVVAVVGVVAFIILAARENGKFMLKPLAQWGLTLLSTGLLVFAVAHAGKPANIIFVILLALAVISLVFSQVCVMYDFYSETLDRVRFIAHLAIAFLLCLVSLFKLGGAAFLFSFLGVIAAAVPVAENFLNSAYDEDEETEPASREYAYAEYGESSEDDFDENEPELDMFPSIPRPQMAEEPFEPAFAQPVANPLQGYQVEEYAEAIAYDGGPVSGVELAEEVNPTFMPRGQVSTGGYDFYNCQSFDPFIASLNNEERNQFTEIFILKYKGTMPELPDYVVGGDNREFFRKIFIYLGQYRERIPNGLLNKIYAFSTKIS